MAITIQDKIIEGFHEVGGRLLMSNDGVYSSTLCIFFPIDTIAIVFAPFAQSRLEICTLDAPTTQSTLPEKRLSRCLEERREKKGESNLSTSEQRR